MTLRDTEDLPVREALPDVLASLERTPNAVLVAPPGAGKTTLVPLALLETPWCERIVLLEPRRIAARAAAARMASLLGERVGETVGLRVRLETRVSARTRIEVVTEGVFTRMIGDDPTLDGVSAVLLDEFHERSLDADLALALALDSQGALRPDLRLLAMSATLDGARVAELMGAPVIRSEGRAYPVVIEHRERRPDERVEDAVAQAVRAEPTERGTILAFLPGQREIERTLQRLSAPPHAVAALPLYGALPPREQDAAIRPSGEARVVLATAIAETSLTIPGVTTVIDSGLTRRPRFDPASGLTRLETVRVSLASADQRAGRAGRTGPGRCVRLWRREQTAALDPFARPEILAADLAPLALDLAAWGVSDPGSLRWLDPPPGPAWNEARALLRELGAVSDTGLTEHGRRLASLPLPPRLAQIAALAPDPERAALLALLIQERGLGGEDVDLAVRLERVRADKGARARAVRTLAARIAKNDRFCDAEGVGATLARGLFDRVARRGRLRDGRQRFTLANGGGCEIDAAHPLARAPFVVVADVAGRAGAARMLAAAAIEADEIRDVLADRIASVREPTFDAAQGAVRVRERERLGAVALSARDLASSADEAAPLLLDAIRTGRAVAPWTGDPVLDRLRWLGSGLHDDELRAGMENWLLPFAANATRIADLQAVAADALLAKAGHTRRSLDAVLPATLTLPTGRQVRLDYGTERIRLHVRPQELFGLDRHPEIAGHPVALVLLSPAGRPMQTTSDLPGFWRGSWRDVRAEMRGRYPKHPWPVDPLAAAPTQRTKRNNT